MTVMFCDMAGSTALSSRLDPEDLREVIRGFQDACVRAIRRFDGFIAKFMGDGVLAYFGYPRAHEDDAERAVRAGLAVIDVISQLMLPTKARLEVRVGIATGLVVVGETLGEGSSQEQVVIGETPNLAARLQGIAEPNAVVIADGTRQLLGRIFDLEDLGPRFLKGMANPVPSWRVVGEHTAESRFEAGQAQRATGFFGREREVDLLMDRWVQAQNGEGQVILLSGEAGIGKSRIVAALREKIVDEAHTRIVYQCSPHHTNSPFYPVISQLERAAGIAPDDPAETKLDKLEPVLRRSFSTIDHVAPLFATLLSLPFEGRYVALSLTPRELKERTLLALIELLGGLAKQCPVLFVLEDAHWIDPTTLDLFTRTIDRLQRWPVLLIVTFRPEFAVPWGHYPHVTTLALNRLGQRHVAAMIDRLTNRKVVPADVRDEIIAKTDGVPLFVEELTKAVLGSGLLKETADRYVLHGPLPPLAIPGTLHDSLMARLDRLASVREIAQIGAAIGREFSYQLLDAVAPVHDKALEDALDQLSKADLIFPRGVLPEATYIFKHALVQDAAYRSLLRSTRRQLHGRIAQAITELTPQIVETQPELLAHHYAQAGLIDDAIAYGLRAGRRSAARSANEEAITHYTKALELLATKSEGAERDRLELELLIALGVPTIAARGYMAADIEVIYGRARQLCDRVPDTLHLFTVLRGLWNAAFLRQPLLKAQELSSEVMTLANAEGDDTRRALAHRAQGCSFFFRGEFGPGWESFRRAIDLWDVDRARTEILVYGEDPSVLCRAYGSWLQWCLGYPDKSGVLICKALADAERLSNPFIYAFALGLASLLHILRNEFSRAIEYADASSAISTEHGFPQWAANAMIMRGRARAALGVVEDGIAEMEEGWAGWQALGGKLITTHVTVALAEACMGAGRMAAGLNWIKVAAEHARTFHERFLEAEIHRAHGELLLARGATGDAEACLRRSMKIAQHQKAKSLELRTATVLAQLWQHQGQREAAYDLVAPIYGWFSEGFDSPDLRNARALLDDLA
ncbi:AAA family ATPase [Bradyrhizobium sp. AUGA SZCCT0431]|uniref:ATP-binding protein n=1 Tax=Bradyrhizobium sp. AUGA SZCCT0431 TaxID=2807674 RepID=UPI0024C0B63D|nr:AAA family ATPase [Bradyrhizobium sp. AUGA SZCCT0431]